jgi:hypothetical protein
LVHYARQKDGTNINGAGPSSSTEKTVVALANLFCFQFSGASARLKKTRHLIYCAVRLFTESTDLIGGNELFSENNYPVITTAVDSIHATYEQVASQRH